MQYATEDVLFEVQVRARMARDLVRILCIQRTDQGWNAEALIDDCLDRLCRQLDLLSGISDSGPSFDATWRATHQTPALLRIPTYLPAGPHD